MAESTSQRVAREEYEQYQERRAKFTVRQLLDMRSNFQRPKSQAQVRKIIREWDINLWEMPVVGQLPDGSYVLNEGQHRTYAAQVVLGDDAEIECRLVATDHPGKLFVELGQSKRRIQALDIFRAQAADGNTDAAKALALVRSFGFDVDRGNHAFNIKSAGMLIQLYRSNEAVLGQVLSILGEVIRLRNNEPGWVKGNVLATLHVALRFAKMDHRELAKRLARGNPSVAVPHGTNDLTRNVLSVVQLYNYGRREENRIDLLDIQKKMQESQQRTAFH